MPSPSRISTKELIETLFFFLGVFALIHAVIFGIALGEGYLIHWMVPSLDFPIAVVIALAINLGTIFFALGFFRMVYTFRQLSDGSQVEEVDDEELHGEEDEEEEEEEEQLREEDLWDKPPRRPLGELHFNWDEIVSRRRRKKKR